MQNLIRSDQQSSAATHTKTEMQRSCSGEQRGAMDGQLD
jgi:hypothetical protein